MWPTQASQISNSYLHPGAHFIKTNELSMVLCVCVCVLINCFSSVVRHKEFHFYFVWCKNWNALPCYSIQIIGVLQTIDSMSISWCCFLCYLLLFILDGMNFDRIRWEFRCISFGKVKMRQTSFAILCYCLFERQITSTNGWTRIITLLTCYYLCTAWNSTNIIK